MIRNVVVHLLNEQPILVDLVVAPKPVDVSVICCNVRTMSGKQPVFVDRSDSTFMIPLTHIRFMELRLAAVEEHEADAKTTADALAASDAASARTADENSFAVPLGRLAWVTGVEGATEPGPESEPEPAAEPVAAPKRDPDEIDPDLLRRIREA
jgi:hypothetical protein